MAAETEKSPGALPTDEYAGKIWTRYQRVKDKFRLRDERYHNLVKLLGGMFYSNDLVTTVEMSPSQMKEVQQTTGSQLVINRLAVVVRNYKNYLSQPPEIDVPARRKKNETSVSKEAEKHADTNEKLLYATWGANRMELELQGIAHYTSGLGSCPIQLWPDINEKVIKYHVLRPWTFYPMTRGKDFRRYRYVCIEDVMWGDEIKEEYRANIELNNPALLNDGLGLKDDEQYIVVHYFSDAEHGIVVGEYAHRTTVSDQVTDEAPLHISGPQTIVKANNILGFIPFICIPGNYIPHQDMGESDIEQSVGLNYYVNEMFNTQADIAAFTSNPILVLTGTSIPTEKIPNHPGAAISIPENGAKAFFLNPPNVAGDYFQQIDRVMRYIEESTNQPEPLVSGRVQPSVESGSAIQALMGGVASQVATKQRVFKVFFEQLNTMTLRAYEKVFPKETISLHGTMGAYSGEHFYVELKGSEIDGWHANEVIYREGMFDFGSRIVNTLQMLGSNLISRRTARRQVGVRSPLEEEEQIRAERLEDLMFAGKLDAANRGMGDVQRERQGLQRGKVPEQNGLPSPDNMAGLVGALQNPGAGPGTGPTQPPIGAVPSSPGSAPPDEAAVKRALGKIKFVGKAYLLGIGPDGIRVAVTRDVDKPKVERALEGLGTPIVEVVEDKPEGGVRIRGAR